MAKTGWITSARPLKKRGGTQLDAIRGGNTTYDQHRVD